MGEVFDHEEEYGKGFEWYRLASEKTGREPLICLFLSRLSGPSSQRDMYVDLYMLEHRKPAPAPAVALIKER